MSGLPEWAETCFDPFDLASRSSLVVAVSGGGDSMALLYLLQAWQRNHNPEIDIVAVTVDHRLRAGAAAEARQVGDWCAALGIRHIVQTVDAELEKNLQSAARNARYELLAETADALGTDIVLLGHTLNDQVETCLMRAKRGQGPGLAGMDQAVLFDRKIWLLRPLLHLTREDLRTFLRDHNKGWIDDPTNQDEQFERVRIRQDLDVSQLTHLAQEIGERADRRCALTKDAARVIAKHLTWSDEKGARFELVLDEVDDARRLALRALLACTGGCVYLPSEKQVDELIANWRSDEKARVTLSACVIDFSAGGLVVYRERRNFKPLVLEPGKWGIWDQRFVVRNMAGRTCEVIAGGERNCPPVLEGQDDQFEQYGRIPYLAPYERFLTGFDLPLANSIAEKMGRELFDLPPICARS